MKEIRLTYEEVIEDYPELINDMISELRLSNSSSNQTPFAKITFFYYWTLDHINDPMEEYKHMLLFNERVQYEKEKIHLEVYIRAGDYIRGDKPESISDRVLDELKSVVASAIRYEQSFYKNQEILDSIPNNIKNDNIIIDYLLGESDENIYSNITTEIKITEKTNLSMDNILDKISLVGYENLSEEEKEFLSKISKK